MLSIKLKDKNIVELSEGSTGKDLAEKLHLNEPNEALAIHINGTNYDLTHKLQDGDEVTIWNFEDPEGKEIFWHSSAHVLAQAILRLWPDAKPTIGPPIENGFYYDFANLTLSEDDFEKIEKEMKNIISKNDKPLRKSFANKEEAINFFPNNSYKCELIKNFENNSTITAYQQGEFIDLCRGPHLPNLGKIKALKVLKTSGAYWKGDSSKEMLTRVYAISFPNRKELKQYLRLLEEAKKRDHKIIGPKMGFFSLKEEAPGMPFIYPKGMIIWNRLIDFWKETHFPNGYEEIKTPVLMSQELWEKSGHWNNYRENMYTSTIEEREFAIKPMNCPGCMLYYRSTNRSYRELPLKIAEIGNVHRAEPSGAVSGLMRVRCFHQDDAHIFMLPSQIKNEVLNVLHLANEIYTTFGLTYHLELSTRPEKDTIGSDKDWILATEGLRNALDGYGQDYRINEGDGAFYGPKIDYHIRDAIGRTWQCGTIQLDMALPERFELEYTAKDGSRQRPVMLHRALYGSLERFFGILIEHFSGRFPMWLSPRQVQIITVADRHTTYAKSIAKAIHDKSIICDVDDSHESISKKVRNAQMNQYNYILTVGDKELEEKNVSLRTRDNTVHGAVSIDNFLQKIVEERDRRSLSSPYLS